MGVFCKTRELLDTVEGHQEFHVEHGALACDPVWARRDARFVLVAHQDACVEGSS